MSPINTFEDVIREKGEEWREPLTFARTTLATQYVSDRNLIRLTKGRCTIPHLHVMTKILFQDYKERPMGVTGIDQFFRVVDYSQFVLFDWLEAIVYFDEWLTKNNRKTSFFKMLGYIQCCEESPENKDIAHKLTDLVKDMLNQHGYEG